MEKKKEIGMGKLMGYVEEMQKEGINICRPRFQEYYLLEMVLVSKYYGLIQWLVDNDKIDFSWEGKFSSKSIQYFDGLLNTDYENLIMVLAVSDSPIEDLISYLK